MPGVTAGPKTSGGQRIFKLSYGSFGLYHLRESLEMSEY